MVTNNEDLIKYKFLKRLNTIKKINMAIENNEKIPRLYQKDRIAYILWKYPKTRESYIELALQVYKVFYPEYVKNGYIMLNDFFVIPKMYDIQRAGAFIQNDERLFRPNINTRIKRKKQQIEYLNNVPSNIDYSQEYYLYLDDSGKEGEYFFLAGVLISGEDNKQKIFKKLCDIKNKLDKKYQFSNKELKFTEINKKNSSYYNELIEHIVGIFPAMVFCSAEIKNSGLSRRSKKEKSIDVMQILLEPITYLATRYTLKTTTNTLSSLHIIMDVEGPELDASKRAKISQELRAKVNADFEYFAYLKDFKTEDSKKNILIQLSDLYASSLNYVFSNKEIKTENAKVRRAFAELFLSKIGIKKIDTKHQGDYAKVEFINELIE